VLTSLGVAVANTSQGNRAGLGLDAGEENGLVASQAFGFKDWMPFNYAISGVAFLSGHKENSFVIQSVKPSVISIGAIHDDDAIHWQIQSATNGNVVSLAIRDGNKARE